MSRDGGTVLPAWLRLVSDGRTAAGDDRLRHWGISETWRVRWTEGPSTIVKRGAGEEALALDVHERPHAAACPPAARSGSQRPRSSGSWSGRRTVWTVRALRWVLEEGVHVVPESATWIDELVGRAGAVTDELARLSRDDTSPGSGPNSGES